MVYSYHLQMRHKEFIQLRYQPVVIFTNNKKAWKLHSYDIEQEMTSHHI